MNAHKMCLMNGHFETLHHGFKTDMVSNLDSNEWHTGSGTCDCRCSTCKEIHGRDSDGTVFFIYRYAPNGREVAKVKIVT